MEKVNFVKVPGVSGVFCAPFPKTQLSVSQSGRQAGRQSVSQLVDQSVSWPVSISTASRLILVERRILLWRRRFEDAARCCCCSALLSGYTWYFNRIADHVACGRHIHTCTHTHTHSTHTLDKVFISPNANAAYARCELLNEYTVKCVENGITVKDN